ncbi:MAG: PASTA domain-containing protein [Clostridia bacterium]|nr:PASTA domain-containing protein [Clostridia bacterium]
MGTVKNRTDRKTFRRLAVAFCLFIVIAVVIVGRLAKYQLRDYDYYEAQVIGQLTTETNINPQRGQITDRNGIVLATNKTVYNVIISPKDVAEMNKKNDKANSDDDPDNDVYYDWTSPDGTSSYRGDRADEFIAHYLSATLGVDYSEIMERMGKTERQYEVVKKEVEEEVNLGIRDFIAEYGFNDLIYDRASYKRYYPYGDLAAHVIGFTNSDGAGRAGLEEEYNNLLEGKSGKYVLAQDARNNDMFFEFETFVEEENGYTLVTTIDQVIQKELENQLKMTYYDSKARNRVCGIVMDVETGGILAMATYPTFDLNDPYTLDEDSQAKLDQYEKGTEEYDEKFSELLFTMWKNKAITETYEPGSTFKIMTTAMALEEQVCTFDTPFTCTGGLVVEGWPRPISCHDTNGHGTLAFRYGLQQSCNPTLMQVAALVGKERFYKYFEAFGYMSRTGIDLPGETAGIYNDYDSFTNVSLAVYSFGQTFKTTPIQQLTAITTVAGGGYYKTPHLIKEILDSDGNVVKSFETDIKRQVVSTEVCDEIAEVLEDGVSHDGGAKNAYVKGYKVAAKTGTSEKRDTFDENGVASFRVGSCAAFAPAFDPMISAIIMVDEPMIDQVYGSVVAAPYISRLLDSVLPYLGVERQYTESDLATLDVSIPNYVGGSPSAAYADLAERGLMCEIIGDGDVITSQFPAEGTTLRVENGRVLIYCGDVIPEMTTVPDVMNMSADAANSMIIGSGLNIRITGSSNGTSATVINQYPAAGSMVEVGTVVEIEARYLDMRD